MWQELTKIMNEATTKGLSKGEFSIDHNRGFLNAVKHANKVFAAFKTHAMGKSMASKLLDDNGNLKPFDKWMKDISSISSHHVGSWLKTEYNTAVLRAHNAADWRSFIENKDIMPNLRWMPTTSPDAEAVHRGYWEKKLTLPVEHPFWNKHHPGDRWNCKCSLESTDDPASPDDVLDDLPIEPAQRGLENNPGKDGKIFNDTHPYFPKNCNQCSFYKNRGFKNKVKTWFSNQEKDCFNCPFFKDCISEQDKNRSLRLRAKKIKEEVEFLKESKPTNKEFPHSINVYATGIKEWLNQPHKHYKEKNELLTSFLDVFYNAKYRGSTDDNKERDGVEHTHVFEIELNKEKSWILVHEMKWGEYKLHSISDNVNVTKDLKK
nr:MAG TPA: minor capsid component [Caudoviricetes sp.]